MSPNILDLVWRCADCPELIPVLTGDDAGCVSQLDFACLRQLGFVRPGDTVWHVVCLDCAQGHTMEVTPVAYPDGTQHFFGICPENGRVEVPRERLLQWVVDFGPILATIMTGLGSPGSPMEVVPGRVWNLGRVALTGQSRPLWAVRGMTWVDAAAVARGVPQGRSPVVFVLGQYPDAGILDLSHQLF